MVYKLFANCIPVKGTERSLICDVQRTKYDFIPNFLCHFLSENEYLDFDALKSGASDEECSIIEEYIDFLIKNEYIFTDTNLELFPKMNLDWDPPFPVCNAIVYFSELDDINEAMVVKQLSELGVQMLEIRIANYRSLDYIQQVLSLFESSNINSISLIVNNYHHWDYQAFSKLCQDNLRICQLVLYNNPGSNDNVSYKVDQSNAIISIVDQADIDNIHCGRFSPDYFSTYLLHFTESQQHNTCLNRKIAIDANGEIRNCPDMTKSYGNIRDTTLAAAIEKPGFKDLWYIQKDQIAVCKDCEFRHICTDCRAYLENPENLYSKPLKCGYNPYTCTWEEWSTNPLKQKAIEYYGMQSLIK